LYNSIGLGEKEGLRRNQLWQKVEASIPVLGFKKRFSSAFFSVLMFSKFRFFPQIISLVTFSL
jgi:hypothetical protein